MRTGEVILIPSGMMHAVDALEDTLEYDVFTPPRQDWTDPGSTFLRGGTTLQVEGVVASVTAVPSLDDRDCDA